MGVHLPNFFCDKQVKIVYLLCQGLEPAEVSETLNLKISYVYNKLYDAYKFLELKNRVQLVVKYYTDEPFRTHIDARYESLQAKA